MLILFHHHGLRLLPVPPTPEVADVVGEDEVDPDFDRPRRAVEHVSRLVPRDHLGYVSTICR